MFERFTKQEAETLNYNLQKCAEQLQLKCPELQFLQIPDLRGNFSAVQDCLDNFLAGLKKKGVTKNIFATIILGSKGAVDYNKMKVLCTSRNIMSQAVQKFTIKRLNLSVASNILKQVNQKLGGDSVRMKLPKLMYEEKVMIIGIDVCHAGKSSIVGFAASINQAQTQYFSDIIPQNKFQEIIKKELDRCVCGALKAFQSHNDGHLPSKIIIYRDGMGE